MRRSNQPWLPAATAELDWQATSDSPCPRSRRFGDIYYSTENGLEESRYVFLHGNDLPGRCSAHPENTFCVAETGFGTGLNFLLTWQAWRSLPDNRPRLHYLAVEKHPLTRQDLDRALAAWPELGDLRDALINAYPMAIKGCHRLTLDDQRLTLDLWWEDATDTLCDLASREAAYVDAWYLDGFAPALNARMWSADLLHAVGRLSRPGATFATFTAAGQVRRDLLAAGFDVTKSAGFGRTTAAHRPATALVVGGGLAGCTTAAALARRGVVATLLEREALATGGSGNQQGILYTRLSTRHSALTDFALASFCHASRYYRALLVAGRLQEGQDGALCGSFHQNGDDEEMAYLAEALSTVPELGQVLDKQDANRMLGVEQVSAGYWFPGSGWLRPVSICQAVAASTAVEILEHCGEVSLRRAEGAWQAYSGKQLLAPADCAVIATGLQARAQAGLDWLPLRAIRGQTTQVPTSNSLGQLRAALCHSGYVAPARAGEHCIGATFDLHDDHGQTREADHRHNLQALAAAVPAWQAELDALDPADLEGRVGYRCATPDYLPLVGPAPDLPVFLQTFAELRKNARQVLNDRGTFLPDLYLNTGHGSRGLSSTPLAAEYLASLICVEPPPLTRELCRALAPARFIIRDLGRNRK
jgi:tRNA 5-methylaminomethyl-2-thiouridine biosynthesis bifunctional protein